MSSVRAGGRGGGGNVVRRNVLTTDIRHPVMRFFDEWGNVHPSTQEYARSRLKHVDGAVANSVFAQCDLVATWGLHSEREQMHLVWWHKTNHDGGDYYWRSSAEVRLRG